MPSPLLAPDPPAVLRPPPSADPRRREPFPRRDLRLHRVLAFALGFSLPLLTLKTGYYGTPTDFSARVAISDVLCLLSFALLCARGSPSAVPLPGGLYFFALIVSLFPALVLWPGPELFVWTTLAGVLMGFVFYLLGLSIGESRAVATALLAGLAWVTLGEFVIVLHDYFSPAQWFPDPMEGRARGTFKANGQLGAFGFCAAGLLLSMSRVPSAPRMKTLCLVAGLLAGTFVFTASRRTGMICVVLWALAFAIMGVRFSHRRFYKAFIVAFVLLLLTAGVAWGTLSRSFAGQRLSEGLSTLGTSDGFIRVQHANILRTAGDWFPLGFGPGRGNRIDPSDPERHEIHNGLLAVLVELGVLGFLGYVGIVLHPLLRGNTGPRTQDREVRAVLLKSFILVSFIFMFHNTLYRDRTFLLFLGMATGLVRSEKVRPRPLLEGPS